MPIYFEKCPTCSREAEDIRSVAADTPLCCGIPMVKIPQRAAMAMVTRGGNWMPINDCRRAKGNTKPKTISRGNGIGGRRKPPSIRKQIAQSGRAGEIRALAKGKT